ncbi:cuticle protein 6.4-like [Thrips palmi]|uniref:Cuticle protein 6.4-like n=1 Tax=Thrips palmi TaxID=161013 RepID=A0A6P9A5Y6_THRPL|nr:cuticle protein 6.4-like [Thrips palmi]
MICKLAVLLCVVAAASAGYIGSPYYSSYSLSASPYAYSSYYSPYAYSAYSSAYSPYAYSGLGYSSLGYGTYGSYGYPGSYLYR